MVKLSRLDRTLSALSDGRRRETLERMIGNLARDVYDQIMEDF